MTASGTVTLIGEDLYEVGAAVQEEFPVLFVDIMEQIEGNRLPSFLATAGLRVVGDLPTKKGESAQLRAAG